MTTAIPTAVTIRHFGHLSSRARVRDPSCKQSVICAINSPTESCRSFGSSCIDRVMTPLIQLLEGSPAVAVIGRLSNVKQLSVFPTTTMLRYNARTDDPAAIAKALNTDAVLSGTIQRVGDRLRVTVQLSDGKNNRALWSDTFEETFTDVFSIQDSIANKLRSEEH